MQQTTDERGAIKAGLVGRDLQLDAFKSRFESSAQLAPVIISGPAGIGKTSLIKAFEAIARDAGWRVVSDTATKGVSERMRGTYLPAIQEMLAGKECARFERKTLAEQLVHVAENLTAIEKGLLITIDHLGKSAAHHVSELVEAVMRAQERKLPVQLAIAGRTAEIRDFLNAPTMHQLNEAEHFELRALSLEQTEQALRFQLESCPALSNGADSLDTQFFSRACRATHGYPFMVQLVGEAIRHRATENITDHEFTTGLASAQEKLGSLVLNPLLSKLSAGDRAFLEAMAEDDGPSKMSDISARLGKNPQYAGVYRNRLVESQIIRASSYGKVTFVIPHLREYLRSLSTAEREDGFNDF